ncbi:hypothetical protein G9A89_009190 [Geosiphon pyriformis]|nr:hypothetical protein G9A89_009190 [Geosiphon pyriformis]
MEKKMSLTESLEGVTSIGSIAGFLKSLLKLLGRGVIIEIKNSHDYINLRNGQKYSKDKCKRIPTHNILSKEYGYASFKSRIKGETTGVVLYELVTSHSYWSKRLFLLIGWKVEFVGKNLYFVEVIQKNSPIFQAADEKSLHLYLELSLKKYEWLSGNISTTFYFAPETRIIQISNKDKKQGWFNISAGISDGRVPTLEVQITLFEKPPGVQLNQIRDDEPITKLFIDSMKDFVSIRTTTSTRSKLQTKAETERRVRGISNEISSEEQPRVNKKVLRERNINKKSKLKSFKIFNPLKINDSFLGSFKANFFRKTFRIFSDITM